MATSLAAAIEREFGIRAQMVEGHDGIYEVAIDGEMVYSNQSMCCQPFPSEEMILAQMGRSVPPAAEKDPAETGLADAVVGLSCAWSPAAAPGEGLPAMVQEQETPVGGCGCASDGTQSVSLDEPGCCAPSREDG